MSYCFEGLDPGPYRHLFSFDDAELAQQGIVRMTVDSPRGFPCRVTLTEAQPGDNVLLLNHASRTDAGPYRATHAIFVSESGSAAARYLDEIPPALATRQLSLRAFDAAGMMVAAMLTEPGAAEDGLLTLLDNPAVVEVDAHNAVRGCFAARARRV